MAEVLKLFAAILTLFNFLGPWGVAILIATILGIILVFRAFGDRMLEGVVNHVAGSLGKPLKDAAVTVHSVTSAPEPDPSVFRTGDDEEDDAFEEDLEASGMPEGDYEWYKIDAEISPRPDAEGNPVMWNPDGIGIRPDDGATGSPLEFDENFLVAQHEVWRNGEFTATGDYGSVVGSARVRLYVGVAPGTRNVRFWYLGVLFGKVALPSRARVTA